MLRPAFVFPRRGGGGILWSFHRWFTFLKASYRSVRVAVTQPLWWWLKRNSFDCFWGETGRGKKNQGSWQQKQGNRLREPESRCFQRSCLTWSRSECLNGRGGFCFRVIPQMLMVLVSNIWTNIGGRKKGRFEKKNNNWKATIKILNQVVLLHGETIVWRQRFFFHANADLSGCFMFQCCCFSFSFLFFPATQE